MRTFLCFIVAAIFGAAIPALAKTERGEINGAQFRIDVPDHWNGSLVMYCHGYAAEPVTYKAGELPPFLRVFTDAGFAVAQSGYAAGGWAVEQAQTDIEGLRRYFISKYRKPRETFVTGHSMGGFLTMMMMEKYPGAYDAGLALCGPLAPANYFMPRGAFDLRVVYDYYFPGTLPPPDRVPADYKYSKAENERILALLDAAPEKAAQLRKFAGLRSNKDLAGDLPFLTFVLKDLEERAGGNPFDNRSIIYDNTDDYNQLNKGVKRYAADPAAARYLETWYTPSGRLAHPMLAVHTTYDPLVPVRIPNMYQSIVEHAGDEAMFEQKFVPHDGHCAILSDEISHAFAELREWKSSGKKPRPGIVQ